MTKFNFNSIYIENMEATTHEAKTHLSKYLKLVEEGEIVTILRSKQPVAQLISCQNAATRKRPKVGTITSEGVTYSDDCFAPLSGEELDLWGV